MAVYDFWYLMSVMYSSRMHNYKVQLLQMSHNIRKYTFGYVRPAMIQIILHIHTGLSIPPLGAFWIVKDAKFLHADNHRCTGWFKSL